MENGSPQKWCQMASKRPVLKDTGILKFLVRIFYNSRLLKPFGVVRVVAEASKLFSEGAERRELECLSRCFLQIFINFRCLLGKTHVNSFCEIIITCRSTENPGKS